MTTREHADSPESQAENLAAVARGVQIPACVSLKAEALPFWKAIIAARLPQEWAEIDLLHAANLARCFADIEAASAKLDAEGATVVNAKGTPVGNPLHAVIADLTGRSMALTRVLQLHAAIKVGKLADTGARKAEAKTANETLATLEDQDDDLLARPRAH